MNNSPREKEETRAEARRKSFIMLFYPFSLAMITAGASSFLLLILGFSFYLAATVGIGFFAISSSILYTISKPAIELLNMRKVFLSFVVIAVVLAVLSFLTLVLTRVG